MTTINERHNQAMGLVERALLARLRGNLEEASSLFAAALELELSALEGLDPSVEPTYSVLHRSAATLALDCNEVRMAERLASRALAHEPPIEVAEELRDIVEQANFRRHLGLKGVRLSDDELQLSLSGKAVLDGLVAWNEVSSRIDQASKLFQRLLERQLKIQFRERGAPRREIREGYQLLVSTPRAASFAVTLKFVGPDSQLRLPGDLAETVDEFMDLLELANRSGISNKDIQEKIPDPPYLRNFVALARQIAPDGDIIRQVGFTLLRNNIERHVSLTKPASQFPLPPLEDFAPTNETDVEVRGVLRYADATRNQRNRIRVVEDNGKVHSVRVPEGLMDDIVRPMWNYRVAVKGVRKRNSIELQDITVLTED